MRITTGPGAATEFRFLSVPAMNARFSLGSPSFPRLRAGTVEAPCDGIVERVVRGVNDVGRDPDRVPSFARAVGALDHHAGNGAGAGVGGEDAHLVIDQPH